MPGTIPRRAEHQTASRGRRARAADERDPHSRSGRRQPAVATAAGPDQVPRIGPGRPRSKPVAVLADKAYSHPSTRSALRQRRIRFTSPERADQIARRKAHGATGGRPPAVDLAEYQHRNVVERCFNRLKQFRDFATRYAKRAAYWRAEIIIAATILWLR